jgi:hypothetical protein
MLVSHLRVSKLAGQTRGGALTGKCANTSNQLTWHSEHAERKALFILEQASLIASVAGHHKSGLPSKTIPMRLLFMTTEFNELLSLFRGDRPQIWILGDREQVLHIMNEFCVKQIAPDRARFMPLVPIVAAPGKFMTILER